MMEEIVAQVQHKKYDAFKDSGMEWFGMVPEHWSFEKGKWLFHEEERPVQEEDDIVTAFRDGEVTLRKNRRTEGFTNSIKEHGYQGIRQGDLVIHSMDAFAGAIGVSDSNGKSTPVYSVCTPRDEENVNPYFYAYLLRNLAKTGFIESLAKGIRQRSTDFRFNDFRELLLLQPPIDEQNRIVSFVDKKTDHIDRAIAQKERLIELLNERRQIVIHKAVTQGLKPDVPMKDSGVEWIGAIPEHWEVKPLKYIAHLESGETISSASFTDDGYPVYGGNGFRGYTDRYTNDGEFALVGRQGALCGNVNYAKGKFFASEHAVVVYPLNNENYLWLGEAIKLADFNRLSRSAAQPGISVNIVKNVKFPYPSSSEMEAIARFIKKVDANIVKAIESFEKQIQKLTEYKTTLINSAVTGKIKV